MQALAFGGGVNDVANPKYVRVYRQKADGTVTDATFKVNGVGFTNAANVKIRPGDVISVEHTVATDTRMLFAQIFRVSFNFGGGGTIWD